MKRFDEREYKFLHRAVHPGRREIMEGAPLQLLPCNHAVTNLHLSRKDALISKVQHGCFLCMCIICFIQIMDEHQIRHLLNDIERIRQPACPENLPKAVNLAFQCTSYHAVIRSILYMIISLS